jgi:hypothetical protein
VQSGQFDLSRLERLGQYIRRKGKLFALDQQVLDEFSAGIDEAINYSTRQFSSKISRGHLRLVSSEPHTKRR